MMKLNQMIVSSLIDMDDNTIFFTVGLLLVIILIPLLVWILDKLKEKLS